MRDELTKKIRLNLQNGGDGKKHILRKEIIRSIQFKQSKLNPDNPELLH